MKFNKFLLNLAVGSAALLFGLAWVGVYQFFTGTSAVRPHTCFPTKTVKVEIADYSKFDINNPESVLPINFEENKLTSPHVDEDNAAMFDPEGYYFVLDNDVKKAGDFEGFTINNKNFKVSVNDKNYGKAIAPNGYVSADKDYKFTKISIGNEKVEFETAPINGVKYIFSGKFLVNGNFYTLDENAKVVIGTLTKIDGDAITSTENITFGWSLE